MESTAPTKHCRHCGRRLFHPDSGELETADAAPAVRHRRARDGIATICRSCQRAQYQSRYAEAERARKRARRAANLEAERACARAKRARRRARTSSQVARDRARLRPTGTKRCADCQADLPLSAFNKARMYPDGLKNRCVECANRRRRLRRNIRRIWNDPANASTIGAQYWQLQRCYLCLEPLGSKWSIDHIVPLALGGTDDPSNLAPAHIRCNTSKCRRTAAEAAEDIRARFAAAA